MGEILKVSPLAMVMPQQGIQSNVRILADLNVYGETDHRPDVRVCPVNQKKLSDMVRSVLVARYDTEAPE